MNVATLSLAIGVKWLEFMAELVMTSLMIPALVYWSQPIIQMEQGVDIIPLGALGVLIAVIRTLRNNLWNNCRFRCKKEFCFTLGRCFYDGYNSLVCMGKPACCRA